MRKLYPALAAIFLTAAAPASATTWHGGASAASDADSPRAASTPHNAVTLFSAILDLAGVSLSVGANAASSGEHAPDGAERRYQCDETKPANSSETKDAKSPRSATGPEPVYLAF